MIEDCVEDKSPNNPVAIIPPIELYTVIPFVLNNKFPLALQMLEQPSQELKGETIFTAVPELKSIPAL